MRKEAVRAVIDKLESKRLIQRVGGSNKRCFAFKLTESAGMVL